MASAAGEIFDEHGGDAMAIAELLVQARAELAKRLDVGWGAERAELIGLRVRDEAVKAVVQAARVLVNHEIQPSAFLPFERLKSAVRAHDEDGGRDR